jgi:predicted GIY-YIG superfamily endonuclease
MPFRQDFGGPHLVYRHFDASGKLLYIGMSSNAPARKRWHSRNAPWFDQIASWTFEEFESRSAAMAAEKAAIEAERPLHNKTGLIKPARSTKRLCIDIPASLNLELIKWRSEQADLPNVSEAVRRLVDLALSENG